MSPLSRRGFLRGAAGLGVVLATTPSFAAAPDEARPDVTSVRYPGFGGMVSFEVKGNAHEFMQRLGIIKRAISLGGVESTITSPAKTSHSKMSPAERAAIGVTENLVRLSVGIEEADDLIDDIKQALQKF